MIERYDIPMTARQMFDKVVDIKLIDLYDVIAIASRHPNSVDEMVNELVEIAYSMRNIDPRSHALMAEYFERYMKGVSSHG